MRNILSKVSPRTRRNTIDIPPTMSTNQDDKRVEVESNRNDTSDAIQRTLSVPARPTTPTPRSPNRTEKLKKGRNYPFKERDRVKVINGLLQHIHRKGYIVEDELAENKEGLLEIELDHKLEDEAIGYTQLIDSKLKRERVTIKNPSKQLIPYKYMKCQQQHFVTDTTADTLLRIGGIITFILSFAIIILLLGINKKTGWNNDIILSLFCISQSFCIGIGIFCLLILLFIAICIKLLSKQNNLRQLGSVHDECTSYYWLKSVQYKPWWMCGKHQSVIDMLLQQIGKIILIFFGLFLLSIIIYICDEIEWYFVLICIVFIASPPVFAFDIIGSADCIKFI